MAPVGRLAATGPREGVLSCLSMLLLSNGGVEEVIAVIRAAYSVDGTRSLLRPLTGSHVWH